MKTFKGFIVSANYEVVNDKAVITFFGRLSNNQSFALFKTYKPYFFIKQQDLDKAKNVFKSLNLNIECKNEGFKNFSGEELVTIYLTNPKTVPNVREALHDQSIQTFEADIRFVERFKIDHDIKATVTLKVKDENSMAVGKKHDLNVDLVFENCDLQPCQEFKPELKVLSIDIETDSAGSKLYSIALYCVHGSKVFKNVLITKQYLESKESLKDLESLDFVTVYDSEVEVLKAFQELVLKLDPDIITGWNVIDFDLKWLFNAFKKFGLKPLLGRSREPCSVRVYKDFFRESKAFIPGRVVIDAITLLKAAFIKLEDYKLETAAQEFLGHGKLLTGDKRFLEIDNLARFDLKKLAEYNLKDAELVVEILKKTNALDVAVEKSILTGLPIDRVTASIAALDNLYLRALKPLKIAAVTTDYSEKEAPIKGGYVMEPKPGIYDYVLVLDFKSLYPSIMRTFNIDPLSFKGVNPNCKDIKAPNNACFSKKFGIMPKLLQTLWEARSKAKKEKQVVKSHAIKILMNSFYGALANPSCRFYNPHIAGAVTAFGRHIIQLTARKVEELGFKVIYSDTDSVFVDTELDNEKEALKLGVKIQDFINKFYDNWVKQNFRVKSYLEIEFEKVYKTLFMPPLRSAELKAGAKKRYAGIVLSNGVERLEIVGLEAVRRDWTELAKRFQIELLKRVFAKQRVEDFIKSFVKDLKSGKYDELLVYKKALRKDLKEYTKTTPPHVKAAKKLKTLDSNIIEYVMTVAGPEPVSNQKHSIDYDHYIKKQLKPVANSILEVLGKSFDSIVSSKQQTTLSRWA